MKTEPEPNPAHTPGAMEAARVILLGLSGMKHDDPNMSAFQNEGARIIDRETAAPELLAVCIAIEAYAAPLGAGLLEQLRAAIAKATGGAR